MRFGLLFKPIVCLFDILEINIIRGLARIAEVPAQNFSHCKVQFFKQDQISFFRHVEISGHSDKQKTASLEQLL